MTLSASGSSLALALARDRASTLLAEFLPARLAPLARLACNYWWSWQREGAALFRAVDPEQWELCGHNPVRLLRQAPRSHLERAAQDAILVERAEHLDRALQAELARPCAPATPATPDRPIAFICAEYAIHSSLPVYAGGLGALAGDFVKEASDRALPLVAVGLLYRQGYFHQRLDRSGWQHEYWTAETPELLPIAPVLAADGEPLQVSLPLRGHEVQVRVWRVQVGRIPLFLLDTDVPANDPVDRWITAQLYVGDRDFRLMQYAVLGVAGIRALRAMGIEPSVVHLNEGHAALAPLELARPELLAGAPFAQAVAAARARTVFTTHTPVAAGNESYSYDDVLRVLAGLPASLGVHPEALLDLGHSVAAGPHGRQFGVTELALRLARSANGVSRKHGEVARAMWQPMWPERPAETVPITHVTNGVHLATWMAEPMRALLDKHLGEDWQAQVCDPWRWAKVDAIPDAELWAVRCQLRHRLVEYVRARSVSDRLRRGEPLDYVDGAARTFDPSVLTIGFARRIAAYKRLHLLIQDPRRSLALLTGSRPLQVLIAGKAHPRDDEGKALLQRIFALKHEGNAGLRVAFLEDYSVEMASHLVSGCDVWVNLPRPPLEASGTSGMKAALNGALNLSVLDGWWIEGYDGANGWGIHSESGPDDVMRDRHDADALYDLLEREVVPMFYDQEDGVPRRWVQRIKASLRSIGPAFTLSRMMNDYLVQIYPREPHKIPAVGTPLP